MEYGIRLALVLIFHLQHESLAKSPKQINTSLQDLQLEVA